MYGSATFYKNISSLVSFHMSYLLQFCSPNEQNYKQKGRTILPKQKLNVSQFRKTILFSHKKILFSYKRLLFSNKRILFSHDRILFSHTLLSSFFQKTKLTVTQIIMKKAAENSAWAELGQVQLSFLFLYLFFSSVICIRTQSFHLFLNKVWSFARWYLCIIFSFLLSLQDLQRFLIRVV